MRRSLLKADRERCGTDNGELFALFMDLKKAFDSLQHDILYNKMIHEFHIPADSFIFLYIKHLYSHTELYVDIDGELSTPVKLGRGLRQGCPLSPTLFKMYINELIVKLRSVGGASIPHNNSVVESDTHTTLHSCWYADDGVLFAQNLTDLRIMINMSYEWLLSVGMEMGYNKCGVMAMGNTTITSPNLLTNGITIDGAGKTIPVVNTYTYLGIEIDSQLDFINMANKRTSKGKLAAAQLQTAVQKTGMSLRTIRQLILGYYIPKASYGAGIWAALNDDVCKKIQSTINQVMRAGIGIPKNAGGATTEYILSREWCVRQFKITAVTMALRFLNKASTQANPCTSFLKLTPKHNTYLKQMAEHILHEFETERLDHSLKKWVFTRLSKPPTTQIKGDTALRNKRDNPISNVTFLRHELDKDSNVLDYSEIATKHTQHIRRKTQSVILSTTENLIGLEHDIRKLSATMPQLWKGWEKLHQMRVNAYPITKKLHFKVKSERRLRNCQFGCKKVEDDIHHVLIGCPHLEQHRLITYKYLMRTAINW